MFNNSAYLTDIFDALIQLKLKLQGENGTLNFDHMKVSPLESEGVCWIILLNEAEKKQKLDKDFKAHFQALENEFHRYHKDVHLETPIWYMTRNLFFCRCLSITRKSSSRFAITESRFGHEDNFHFFTEKFWINSL